MQITTGNTERRLVGCRDDLAGRVTGAAIFVHRESGPVLLESVYAAALAIELTEQEIEYERKIEVSALYKG